MPYQAITTKFHGPSNVRGSRIKATCQTGSITLSYSHGLNSDENHKAACAVLVKKLGWDAQGYGSWVMGWDAKENGVHVCTG